MQELVTTSSFLRVPSVVGAPASSNWCASTKRARARFLLAVPCCPLAVQHLMNGVFSSASDHVDETVPCPTALMLHHELLMRPARPALACAGAPSPRAGSGMLASCVAADFGRCGHLTIHLSGLRPAPPGRVLAASPSPSPSEQSIAFGFNWPGEPRPLLRPRVPPQCQPCEHESESLR